jgi:predicted nucleic acid-binding protein
LSELFVLDSGALGALASDDPRMRRLLANIVRDGGFICVPAVVLAECYGDPRHDARYDRALKALGGADRVVVDTTTKIAKEAGRIMRSAGMKETIDAIVVATAALNPMRATIVTGDERHVEGLACCVEQDLGIIYLNDLQSEGLRRQKTQRP